MKWMYRKYLIIAVLFLSLPQVFASNLSTEKTNAVLNHGANWFIAGDVGVQQPNIKHRLRLDNNSGFPAPSNEDILTTHEKNQTLLAVSLGRRWQHESFWFPACSLSLRYEYIFPENVGDAVTQYSLSEFTNYHYKWKLSSNVLLASTKINLFNYLNISPYFNGGAGVAFNHASGYSEDALFNVTPRTSPAFSKHTRSELAYNLGFGVDFLASSQWILSVGYEYQHYGKVSSGHGAGTWANQSLNLGSYNSNAVLLSMSYFIDN